MTIEELAVTNRTFKMTMSGRIVEVVKDGSGWLVSTGTLFLASWQSVWCPSTEKLLQVLEQVSNSKEGEKKAIPEGCKLLKFVEAEESWDAWRNKNWPMGQTEPPHTNASRTHEGGVSGRVGADFPKGKAYGKQGN